MPKPIQPRPEKPQPPSHPLRVVVLHGHIPPDAPPDEQDTLEQVAAVGQALAALGHDWRAVAMTLDLGETRRLIHQVFAPHPPSVVVNLVEALEANGLLQTLAPHLLEHLGLPYTGAGALALELTNHKPAAKALMAARGIPTPPWLGREGGGVNAPENWPGPWIVKHAWEHASLGLGPDSVVGREGVAQRLAQAQFGGQWFAEAFIQGREFNLSVVEGPGNDDGDGAGGAGATGVAGIAGNRAPQVLPVAEIAFEGLAPGAPRLVDYAAKWHPESTAYHSTRRVFPPEESPLFESLRRLALEAWRVFGLRGYARVDFRVDEQGNPWVLEINANPCLAPDAGFAAAWSQGGGDYPALIARLIETARRA